MLTASWLALAAACGAMGWAAYVRDRRAAWKKAASELPLRLDSPRFLPPRLRGREGGFEIVVSRSKLGIVVRVLGVRPIALVTVEPLEGAVSPADESPGDPEGGEVSMTD